jgi:hypothetical protein
MTVKYTRALLAFGIVTAFLLSEAHSQTCSGGLRERAFTIARPPSIFGVSALAGGDATLDPWPEGLLRICGGAPPKTRRLDYTVYAGTSSRDLPLSTTLTVAARNPISVY